MAITLPYPDLEFVPLDILTAEQMNQIVSNYTAIAAAFPVASGNIANGSITGVTNAATSVGSTKLALSTIGTPNLRDGAVTANKINWTTMHAPATVNFSIGGDAPVQTKQGYRIYLGSNVYVYLFRSTISIGASAGSRNMVNVAYPQAFSTVYGGAINGSASGIITSNNNYCTVAETSAQVEVYTPNAVQSFEVNFIAVGKIG